MTTPERSDASPSPRRVARPSRRRRLVFLGVGVVLAVLLAGGLFTTRGSGDGSGEGAGAPEGTVQVGDPVPHFRLGGLGGGSEVSVPGDGGGDGRGAVLLFFASWCTPCQREIPALAGLANRQRSTGSRLATVPLLGIDGNDPTTAALSFVHRSGVAFPVGVDPDYTVTQGRFGFEGLPEAVEVRSDGTVGAVHYGALSPSMLLSWQRQLVARRDRSG